MLWHHTWFETRWRFLAGLALLMLSAASTVWAYPDVADLIRSGTFSGNGRLTGALQEAAILQRDYRGYVWSQWFAQNLPNFGILMAAMLGTGLLGASGSRRPGALLTLSLPVSRQDLIAARTVIGLGEVAVLALIPSLLVPLLSPMVGETYSVVDALIHAVFMLTSAAMFFSLALLLSTAFSGWRPFLIAVCAAFGWSILNRTFDQVVPQTFSHVVSAELYFRTGSLPWAGGLLCVAISAALLYWTAARFARLDF